MEHDAQYAMMPREGSPSGLRRVKTPVRPPRSPHRTNSRASEARSTASSRTSEYASSARSSPGLSGPPMFVKDNDAHLYPTGRPAEANFISQALASTSRVSSTSSASSPSAQSAASRDSYDTAPPVLPPKDIARAGRTPALPPLVIPPSSDLKVESSQSWKRDLQHESTASPVEEENPHARAPLPRRRREHRTSLVPMNSGLTSPSSSIGASSRQSKRPTSAGRSSMVSSISSRQHSPTGSRRQSRAGSDVETLDSDNDVNQPHWSGHIAYESDYRNSTASQSGPATNAPSFAQYTLPASSLYPSLPSTSQAKLPGDSGPPVSQLTSRLLDPTRSRPSGNATSPGARNRLSPAGSPLRNTNSYMSSDSSITRPPSAGHGSTRSRTSQATSQDPLGYDLEGEETERLEQQFMDAIQRRHAASDAESTGLRLSLPLTARSIESEFPHSDIARPVSPSTPTHAQDRPSSRRSMARRSPSLSPTRERTFFRGSKYNSVASGDASSTASGEDADWSLPVVSTSPVSRRGSPVQRQDSPVLSQGSPFQQRDSLSLRQVSPTRHRKHSSQGLSPKELIENFQNRWSLSTTGTEAEDELSISAASDDESRPSPYAAASMSRANSNQKAVGRRMGRLFGSITSTTSSNGTDADLVTPRGSVSEQGNPAAAARMSSIYSTQGIGADTYPFARISEEMPAVIESPSAKSTTGAPPFIGRASEDKRLGQQRVRHLSANSVLSDDSTYGTPLTELPNTMEIALETDSTGVSRDAHQENGTANYEPASESGPPLTPSTADYSSSELSLSLTSDSEQPQASTTEVQISEAEKLAKRRWKTIEELIETERTFARDMAVTRDIWLARARGKELGEILTALRTDSWRKSMSRDTTGEATPQARGGRFSGVAQSHAPPSTESTPRMPARASEPSAPPMMSTLSSSSGKSLRGFNNPFAPRQSAVPPQSSTDSDRVHPLSRSSPASANRLSGSASYASSGSISVFKRPLPENVTNGSALNAALSTSDIRMIFNNIDEVANFAETFVAVLDVASTDATDSDQYGQAFLSVASRLENVYSKYCSHYAVSIARYEDLIPSLSQYTQECKELSAGFTNAWDLPSLLIKPVQRCLKYPLFLQSLLSCTPEGHPDALALAHANARLIKIAETINELKRRQEIVGSIIKPRNRSDGGLPGFGRKASASVGSARLRSISGEANPQRSSSTLSDSVTRKFKRQSSKIKESFALRTDLPPASDATFDALIVAMEAKQKAIAGFISGAKDWSKAVRLNLVALLQLVLIWKGVYAPLPGDTSGEQRSLRTIDHFATTVVKTTLEGPWHDVDQEIRMKLAPKISQLLDLFRNPRAVIAKRNQKLEECHMPNNSKSDKVARHSAAAYYALNSQLLSELPTFLRAVKTFFTAIIARFVTLQTALQRVISERWRQYADQCCTQLGALDQPGKATISAWWELHRPIATQFDNLKILSADAIMREVQKRHKDALPLNLRSRESLSRQSASNLDRRPSFLRRASKQSISHASSVESLRDSVSSTGRARSSSTQDDIPSLPTPVPRPQKKTSSQQDPAGENRSSTISASSVGSSFAFSQRSTSSLTSPSTPQLESLPPLWLGASKAQCTSQKGSAKGYNFLDCEVGDIFDVLDDQQLEDHLLVRTNGLNPRPGKIDIGWLPRGIIQKLD